MFFSANGAGTIGLSIWKKYFKKGKGKLTYTSHQLQILAQNGSQSYMQILKLMWKNARRNHMALPLWLYIGPEDGELQPAGHKPNIFHIWSFMEEVCQPMNFLEITP